ncbi:hypothetical protein [Salipaludibacillus daqingensis]|uniref:hypothetical protein n=1 Tax=Salipaludibacillus daqingensis TaxID=3041001 RepID=UPI002474293B|nr:hypothetical protein [Salipaludibacillus daqingensis]
MFLYLIIFILLLISIASYSAAEKAKKERVGLKFTFSATLAILLPFLVEGTVHSLEPAQFIGGISLFIYALSIILFTTLQLILYDIGLMGN